MSEQGLEKRTAYSWEMLLTVRTQAMKSFPLNSYNLIRLEEYLFLLSA